MKEGLRGVFAAFLSFATRAWHYFFSRCKQAILWSLPGSAREDERKDGYSVKTFEIGQVVATQAVWELLDQNEAFNTFVSGCLSRYILYDWGDTCPEDWKQNNDAVKNGERVMAVYNIPDEIEEVYEIHLWIITEWDRSVTTMLFPSDY